MGTLQSNEDPPHHRYRHQTEDNLQKNFTQVVFQVINYIHISYPPKVNMATNKARM